MFHTSTFELLIEDEMKER